MTAAGIARSLVFSFDARGGALVVSAMDSSVGLGLLFINDYLCVWGI